MSNSNDIMKSLAKHVLPAFVALVLLVACQPKEQRLYIVSTNDMHANIDNFPQMAALIDSLRMVHPDLLLFGAGDNRSGNPINDRYVEPTRPMYELMNKVGFDLSTFGNHEWDDGPYALRNVLTWARFPFVCANVTFEDSLNMPNNHPYVIFERNGLKIGVIGGIQLGLNGLPDFHPKNADGSHFIPIEEVLPQYIEELRSKCDALFLLSHCGYEEDREIAEKFPELDAIFGGHTHTRVANKQIVNGVLVTQAESKVKYLTLSTFVFRKGKMIDKDMQLLSIVDFPKRNADVQKMVENYNNNPFFYKPLAFNKTAISSTESLGCLMTDAIRYTMNADMGFQNPGGVRYDTLSVRPITMKDMLALDPFNNEIIHYTLSGEEIIRLMKSCFVTDRGPIFCSGCSYSYKIDDSGEMTDINVVLENGNPLDMKAKYSIVMNSYMASVFDYEHEDDGEATGRTSNDLMFEYLAQHPEIDYGTTNRVKEN